MLLGNHNQPFAETKSNPFIPFFIIIIIIIISIDMLTGVHDLQTEKIVFILQNFTSGKNDTAVF